MRVLLIPSFTERVFTLHDAIMDVFCSFVASRTLKECMYVHRVWSAASSPPRDSTSKTAIARHRHIVHSSRYVHTRYVLVIFNLVQGSGKKCACAKKG